MSRIYPFPALRPAPEAAARVASVPYDVVNADEAKALASGNRLSFLHVSRPDIDLPDGADSHGPAAYEMAARNFEVLKQAAPLVVEDRPSLYAYRLRMGAHVQTGVAACFSIDEYEQGLIKKHETTRPDKEDDRTRHMLALGAQTGPVCLMYVAAPAVDEVVSRVTAGAPLFDITAPDGIRHQVWRASAADQPALVSAFAAVPGLYIADGHHRAASAARARHALASRGPGEHDRVLAVAFPDDQMHVLPYNRVVRDLHGKSAEAFMTAVGQRLAVRAGGPATPAAKGEVAIFVDGAWHTLTAPARLSTAAGDPAAGLDVSWLQDEVLAPILGIHDVRTDTRIEFVGGIRGTAALEQQVRSGQFAVAFSLYPVSASDLMRIADAGGIMPPKSTWFEPKLRDGLLSHLI